MNEVDVMHISGKLSDPFVDIHIYTKKGTADKNIRLTEPEYQSLKKAVREDENHE